MWLGVLAFGCAGTQTSSPPPVAPADERPVPHLSLDDEATTVAALRARFDALVASPAELDAALADSKRRFPEGDLLPLALAIGGYAQQPSDHIDAMATLLDRAITVVESRVGPLAELDGLHDQGTYLSILDLALGHFCLAGGTVYAPEHDAITRVLWLSLAAQEGAPIASYPDERWPIDTEIAIAAVAMHDRCRHAPDDAAAARAHIAWLTTRGLDPATQLPWTRGDTQPALPPRGSDLSWRIALLSSVDPAFAGALYQRYVDRFWRGEGLVRGFAEWGDGRDLANADSGPIVGGVGATASTLGIAAAAANGDQARRAILLGQLQAGRALVERSHGGLIGRVRIDARYVTGFLMGDATLFYALSWPVAP